MRCTGRRGAGCAKKRVSRATRVNRSAKKLEARSNGARGDTYAYWYLRRNGFVFVAKNYTPREIKGELDLIGYDGKTLAFVEVRTRTVKEDATALPELSVTHEKQRVVIRTAQRFLAERHVEECHCGSMWWPLIIIPASPP